MELDLSKIQSYSIIKKIEDIKDLDINELGDQLNRLVSKKITKFEADQVYLIIKKLEDFTPISYEYLSWLLVTSGPSNDRNARDRIGSMHFKKEVKGRLKKIKAILKSRSKVTVSTKNKYIKSVTSIKGSLQTQRGKRVYHYITLE